MALRQRLSGAAGCGAPEPFGGTGVKGPASERGRAIPSCPLLALWRWHGWRHRRLARVVAHQLDETPACYGLAAALPGD